MPNCRSTSPSAKTRKTGSAGSVERASRGRPLGRRSARRVAAALLLASLGAGPAGAAELPLRRVVLASIGLAQFTHSGPVAGGTSIDLAVRLDQVDDLLKSLTVFDRASGIGAVSLPG